MTNRASSQFETVVGLVLCGVFIVVGAGLILVGLWIQRQRADLLANGETARGKVVRYDRVGPSPDDSLHDTILVPVVQFQTADGEEITLVGTMSESALSNHQVGRSVTVVYDPRQPDNARIDSWSESWFGPALLFAIGLSALIIPPFTLWRHVRATGER